MQTTQTGFLKNIEQLRLQRAAQVPPLLPPTEVTAAPHVQPLPDVTAAQVPPKEVTPREEHLRKERERMKRFRLKRKATAAANCVTATVTVLTPITISTTVALHNMKQITLLE